MAALGVAALLLVAGCTPGNEPDDGATSPPTSPPASATTALADGALADGTAVVTLAKADGWREGLDPASMPGEAGYGVLELAYDEAAASALWSAAVPDDLPAATGDPVDAGRYGSLDDVDLAEQLLGLWSAGQSGSCPGRLASVATDGDVVRLVEVQDLQGGDGCTDDYRPYSQVVVLDREQVPAEDRLPVDGELTFAVVVDGAVWPRDGQALRAPVTGFGG